MVIIKYQEMKEKFALILKKNGVNAYDAETAAEILADNTCDGVASHGINRFSIIIDFIQKGYIKPENKAEVVAELGAVKVVDGKFGLGMTNAHYCMNLAIETAQKHGIGCVAMRNNNHWMRGASYGIQAAKAGYAALCFTNTLPNMPAWGAKTACIGNNPLVISVPNDGSPIVLDMAMSQFSYGKLETASLNEDMLPIDGGYDEEGKLTKDPNAILKSKRILPAGYWKGSGLSIVLDMLAAILSGGSTTCEIGKQPVETGVSQIFIAINPRDINDVATIEIKVNETIEYIRNSDPINEGTKIYYPGEQSAKRRAENMKNGIPVNEKIWDKILRL